MSISELEAGAYTAPSDGPADDRLPPQDVNAEQSVIGGMLLSKDAIADCLEVLRGPDFYRPAHELVYDAVLDLYGRGEPADAITVSDELSKRGDLARVGGQAYLHQLIASVPTAANAGYYAQIVAERAVLRRLVEAGTRIVQMGYAQGGGDVEDIVNSAQAEVYQVADKRGGEDYAVLGDVLEATVDEIETASGSAGEMVGVPTGITDFDALTNGLHPGQMIVVAARPAAGKALALDTPLPTPEGWTTMGDVAVGDHVLGADGKPAPVTGATDVMGGRPCFEVEFSDGSVIVADAEHQWLTDTRASRKSFQTARDKRNRQQNQQTFPAIRTTAEIGATLRCQTREKRLNHSVRIADELQLPDRELPLSPYALGAWLGDGTSAAAQITTADDEIVMHLEAEGLGVVPTASPMRYTIRWPDDDEPCHQKHGSVQAVLRSLGVLGDKHIPVEYLRASAQQRRALLAGLLDTDGTVTKTGYPQFTTTSERLRRDVHELIVGLGYRCAVSSKHVRGRSEASSTAYTLSFSSDEDVFRLTRKNLLHKQLRGRTFQRRNALFVVDVRPVASVPVKCIEVDNDDHLYLAGRSMVPTHNSTLGLDVARSAAIKHNMATVVFSLEMSRTEITMRLLSAEAQIQLQNMRKGTMRDEDWNKLAQTMGRVSEAPLFIDDSPNMSLMEIRAKCRRLKQRNNLKLVIIDYLQLMSSGKRVESRQQEVSEFSRALKLLAKELEVPVIAISQLNRGPEQRTDKKPQMSDLRESGCLTADTRILRADTGAEVTLGQLHAEGARDVPVWALDDSLRYVRRHMTHVFPTGVKPVFRVILASGKTIRATENHPFLAYGGWSALGDLRTGDRVAVPRHVPAPQDVVSWSDQDVILLAHTIGDGSMVERQLPEAIFHVSKRQIALFFEHLWAADGSVTVNQNGQAGRIYYASTSRRLVDDLSLLLLRFGISTRTRTVQKAGYRKGYTIDLSGADSQRRFLQEIGVFGDSSENAERLLEIVRSKQANTDVDTVPQQVWDDVKLAMADQGMTTRELQASRGHAARGTAVVERAPSRERLGRVAAVLDDAQLELMAVNDVLWDTVVSVVPDGVEEVFDATVLGTHNFVANGIAVHNSIEQDADMVILLHRESMYERESPREGEADLIVAKHRNGPTDTIVVAFQGHYSRFTNMATNF